MLLRRADTVAVIGRALTAKASGLGARPVAVVLDRPLGTVRGWLRRFAGKAEQVRAWFTGLLVAVAADPVVPEAAAAVFADAAAAIEAVAWAVAGRLHPAEDGDVVNLDAPLDQQFLDVAVRQVVSQVETDGDHDDGRWEPEPGER